MSRRKLKHRRTPARSPSSSESQSPLSASPISLPGLNLSATPLPHAQRAALVSVLEDVFQTRPMFTPRKRSSKSIKTNGSSWRRGMSSVSSSPKSFEAEKTALPKKLLASGELFSESSESSTSSMWSPRGVHAEREMLVQLMTSLLEGEEEENVSPSASHPHSRLVSRSLPLLRTHASDASNPHRQRDKLVLAMSSLYNNVALKERAVITKRLQSQIVSELCARYPHIDETIAVAAIRRLLSIFNSPQGLSFTVSFCHAVLALANQEEKGGRLFGAMLALHELYQTSIKFICRSITLELSVADQVSNRESVMETLFRSAAVSTGAFSAYYHGKHGKEYLRAVTLPLINQCMLLKQALEPSRDVEKITVLLNGFFKGLHRSLVVCPPSLRGIMHHLYLELQTHFPTMVRSVLSIFLFVRFICPAIVSPAHYGLLKEAPTDHHLRALVLMSKIIANVASGVKFEGAKGQDYQDINPLIEAHEQDIDGFFAIIAESEPPSQQDAALLHEEQQQQTIRKSRRQRRSDPLCKHFVFLAEHVGKWSHAVPQIPQELSESVQFLRRKLTPK